MNYYDLIVVGGGASGFFTAINVARQNPSLKILIMERGKEVLQKVKISGGGRCNVTHAEFIPNELTKKYPRGEKELKGPFHNFMTGDVMEWFEERGVPLKIEDDGRVFPVSNTSQTIIDCFLNEANNYNIEIVTSELVANFQTKENNDWEVVTKSGKQLTAKKIAIATGSQVKTWKQLEALGLKLVAPVPSLFTFNCNDDRIKSLPGVATKAALTVKKAKLKSEGPVLITHWGFSGPAVLKLSAWGARELHDLEYDFTLHINWTLTENFESCKEYLLSEKNDNSRQFVIKNPLFDLPRRLWEQLILASEITEKQRWGDINKKQVIALATQLTLCAFEIKGKSTFKDEFVTAGGVDLKEVNFKTFEANKLPNCYIVGEALNVDAITGGFNFQNAWTSGYLAANAIANNNES